MTTEPRRMLDGYGSGDMAIPEIKLVQNVGMDYAKSIGANPGQFFCPLTDDIMDELKIIVVDIQMTRTYWGREEIEDSPPDCASFDAKSMLAIDGSDCSTCSHRCDAPWLLKPTERRQKCNICYNILGIKEDDFLPVIIRAGGISALPVRQLITQIKLNRSLKGEIHRAIISISAAKKKTSAGEAYALHPKIVELITDEDKANELKAESHRLLGAPIPLPEGRPEEEPVPLGFTPEGIPYYSEAERDRLLAAATAASATPPAPAAEPPAEQKGWRPSLEGKTKIEEKPTEQPVAAKEPEPGKEAEKEPKKELDLNF